MEGGRIIREQVWEEGGEDIFRILASYVIVIVIIVGVTVVVAAAIIVDVCEGTMMAEGLKAGV